MAHGAPEVDSPQEDVSIVAPAIRRERVVVRRRRAHSRRQKQGTGTWKARTSRRRVLRAIIVCATVFVTMALGLYYSLSQQESAPGESSHRHPAAIGQPSHPA